MATILSPYHEKILNSLQYQGKRNDCGPFTTATVINAIRGLNLDGIQLSDEMDKPVWRGILYIVRRIPDYATFPWGMVDVFRSYGFHARWRPFASSKYIKDALPQSKILMPIIGEWKPSAWAHVMSLVAWDEDKGWGFANTQHNHRNIDWHAEEKFYANGKLWGICWLKSTGSKYKKSWIIHEVSLKYPLRFTLAASLVLAGALLLFTWLHKKVVLTIDGQSRSLTTFAPTVAGLFHKENLALAEVDLVSPPLTHWLKEGDVITVGRAIQIPILADGEFKTILTAALVPANILTQAGIAYAAGDLILADGEPVSLDEPLRKNPRTGHFPSLQLHRAVSFSLSEGDQPESFTSWPGTLGQALWQAGIVLSTVDSITPELSAIITPGSEVTLQRARLITILHQDGSYTAQVVAGTVGDALAKAGLPLQSLDYTIPAEDDPIPIDGVIRVVHVQEEIFIEQTPLPFEDELQPAPDLEIDNQKTIQAGEYGIDARRIRVCYEDGQEVSRQVEEEWTARQPQIRIIGYGTSLVEHSADTPDGTISYWRMITMYAVSYSPSSAGGSITASGATLEKGLVAVDTRYIPLGTRLYIPGYGEALAADTGGGVKGRVIDLGYSDEDYVAWHQNVTVYFLWPPPANVVWIFP